MFLAIALAAPRSGLTVSSPAASPEDFAGVVDPAAGLGSLLVSEPDGREAAGAAPLAFADPADEDSLACAAGALPFAALPLADDDAGASAADPWGRASLPEEAPAEDDVVAPAEDDEFDPATLSPSEGV
jgi:hypothetical protein